MATTSLNAYATALWDPVFLKEMIILALNVGLLLGGISVQLPQIIKIFANSSTAGLSEPSWILSVFSSGLYCLFNYAQGYPFLTWGDTLFCTIEYIIIATLIWIHGPSPSDGILRMRWVVTAVGIFLTLITITGRANTPLVSLMGIVPTPLLIMSRVPQILLNYRQRHTGQLALSSLIMQVGGNCARVITTIAKVPDRIILLSHSSAVLFNGAILCQVLYFRQNTANFLAASATKKDDMASAATSASRAKATSTSSSASISETEMVAETGRTAATAFASTIRPSRLSAKRMSE